MEKDTLRSGDMAELFDRAQRLGAVELIDLTRAKVANVPNGRSLVDLKQFLDKYRPTPQRRRGRQTLLDLDSFVAWTNRNKGPASVLFCDPDPAAPSIVAAIDYHDEAGDSYGGLEPDGSDGLAQWVEFSGLYPLELSPRWTAWAEAEAEGLPQAKFASFLEDNALDLYAPAPSVAGETGTIRHTDLPEDVREFVRLTGGKLGTPTDLMSLAKGLDVNVGQKVAERFRLQSGERALRFEETHETKQGDAVVTVPDLFLIAVPVFEHSDVLYRVPVRLRYRLVEGRVVWVLARWRADETFEAALRDMATKAAEGTALPLFYGPAPAAK